MKQINRFKLMVCIVVIAIIAFNMEVSYGKDLPSESVQTISSGINWLLQQVSLGLPMPFAYGSSKGVINAEKAIVGLAFLSALEQPQILKTLKVKFNFEKDQLEKSVKNIQMELLASTPLIYYSPLQMSIWGSIYGLMFLLKSQDVGIRSEKISDSKINDTINLFIEHLDRTQSEKGGWAYYSAITSPIMTHVTAPAIIALIEAKRHGFLISDETINKSIRELWGLRKNGSFNGNPFLYFCYSKDGDCDMEGSLSRNLAALLAIRKVAINSSVNSGLPSLETLDQFIDQAILFFSAEENYKRLEKEHKEGESHNPDNYMIAPYYFSYGMLYFSLAATYRDSTDGEKFVRDKLIPLQHSEGNWEDNSGFPKSYLTAMAILALTIGNDNGSFVKLSNDKIKLKNANVNSVDPNNLQLPTLEFYVKDDILDIKEKDKNRIKAEKTAEWYLSYYRKHPYSLDAIIKAISVCENSEAVNIYMVVSEISSFALPHLRESLNSDSAYVRRDALRILKYFPGDFREQIQDLIIDIFLKESEPIVKIEAAIALSEYSFKSAKTYSGLVKMFRSENNSAVKKIIAAQIASLGVWMNEDSDIAKNALFLALKNEDPTIRLYAARGILENFPDDSSTVVPILVDLAKNGTLSPYSRIEAIFRILKVDPNKIKEIEVKSILDCITSENPDLLSYPWVSELMKKVNQ